MQKVRFGLIGCGMIANFHATAISRIEAAELVGVYDAYCPGAEKFAAERGVRVFATMEELLACEEIDAVCICTPSGLHAEQAIAVANAKKHVIVEKPMSLTLEDADRVIAAVEQNGVKSCVISQLRFSDTIQEVRRAIEAGAFGTIVSASLQMKYLRTHEYYASAGWRGTWAMDGGGCLMNQGIHGIDCFRYLMGPIKTLTAITKTQTRKIEVEDSAVAIVEFANGAVGTIEGSTTCYPGYPRRIEICGDAGSVVLEEVSILRWDLPIPCNLPVGIADTKGGASDPKDIDVSGHIRQISNLVDAVLFDTPLMSDIRSGRPPLEVILGIYESSRTGKSLVF